MGISLIFAGISLIIVIFAVSNENIWAILTFLINFIFWISCVAYPFELFFNNVQSVIYLNPLFFIIDLLRLIWIEDNILLTSVLHSNHIIIFVTSLIMFPLIGVFTFNKIYQKLGIVGY